VHHVAEPLFPTFASVIRHAIEESLADLRVAMPARVERVDLAKGLLDAKPLVKDRVEIPGKTGTQVLSIPVVTNVPVIWPGAGGMRVTFPIAVGDTVLLLFSDRSLDVWLAQGGEVDPLDPRKHALSDAVAIPGLRDFGHPWSGAADDGMTLGADDGMQLKITPSDASFGGGSTPVAEEGSGTVGHVHVLAGAAGPFALVGTALLQKDAIAPGQGSQHVKVP
jgi:hypothetical protein